MKVIGLTGGIATGKSTAVAWFREQGYRIIDADIIAREVVAKGQPCLEKIKTTFGDKVLLADGSLNRSLLGQIIFRDEHERAKLDAIMQPAIYETIVAQLNELKTQGLVKVIVDMPLLYEQNYERLMDVVIVIDVTREKQIKRLMQRNNLSYNDALDRIDSQMPLTQKVQLADYVIDNNGTKIDLEKELAKIEKEL